MLRLSIPALRHAKYPIRIKKKTYLAAKRKNHLAWSFQKNSRIAENTGKNERTRDATNRTSNCAGREKALCVIRIITIVI